ncbi:zinc ABC transporter substrate-binding protein [Halomonas sp. 18H]|uniref:metal ABC transporter solute-binding protein, Zn/Mn family n=1 Tax=Halomonas almeriensis TaxID=308163 RepID=UPI0022313467|nr:MULTISPECIES: zinc ABC transporter substrate-binding protein [Halomonas]MCW4149328.1 zinc ABC transporter substrate-binding protein [Halomonas sp. 18H]MDN3553726.1 zinc ABC transporter substrate-binding protein [Halomonas almeriensis]
MTARRLAGVALLVTTCLTAPAMAQTPEAKPINAVSTTGMVGDVVQQVGGECLAGSNLMGPGVDPHLYQASARDVSTLQQAEIIFYSGYSLEGQLGDVLERLGETRPTIGVAPASTDADELISTQDEYGLDPHLWMDASLWSRIVPTVADALSEVRPACESRFRDNAEAYVVELEALHQWVEESIASIPDAQRILVTAHDAFNYYGRAYGIEVAGIQGLSTSTETGVADIRRMAELVVERGVPAVFVESTISPRTVQAVIEAARQQGQDVSIGSQLYSDAMGEAGTLDGTYIGMLYRNTRHIVEALDGEVAALPDALQDWARRWDIPAS